MKEEEEIEKQMSEAEKEENLVFEKLKEVASILVCELVECGNKLPDSDPSHKSLQTRQQRKLHHGQRKKMTSHVRSHTQCKKFSHPSPRVCIDLKAANSKNK